MILWLSQSDLNLRELVEFPKSLFTGKDYVCLVAADYDEKLVSKNRREKKAVLW